MKMKLCVAVALAFVVGGLSASAEVDLPANYTPLTYIESTGTQFVNTHVSGGYGLESEMEVEFLEVVNGQVKDGQILGAYNNTYRCYMPAISGGKLGYRSGSKAFYLASDLCQANHKYTLVTTLASGMQSLTVDGVVAVHSTEAGTFSINELLLFGHGYYNGGTVFLNPSPRMRLYSCKIKKIDPATTLRDFVPCRDPNGVAGLWDRVSGTFFGNGGTGRFIGSDGEDAGEVLLDYLESTNLSYINTGVTAQNNLESDIDVMFLDTNEGGGVVLGAYYDVQKQTVRRCYMPKRTGGKICYQYNTQSSAVSWSTPYTVNQKYHIITKMDDGAQSLTINDEPVATSTATGSFSFYSLRLFGHFFGEDSAFSSGGRMRLSRCKITQNNFATTLRDYVPRIMNGQVGMYDRANGVHYVNANRDASTVDFLFDIAYTTNETAICIREGRLAEGNCAGWSAAEKTSCFTLDVTDVAGIPVPLTHRAGTISLQSDETNTFAVAGTLALEGGAHLRLDFMKSGCDLVTASALDVTAASVENPVRVDLVLEEGASFDRPYPFLRAEGLTDDMARKFVVTGADNIGVRVEDGALVMFYADPSVATVAVWTGNGSDPRNVAEAANWACTNGFGEAIATIPSSVTRVILPDGCTFSCTNGAPFACKEIQLPATLGADCDWRGVSAPLLGTVDLCGHKLFVSSLEGNATVTDYAFEQLEYIESSGTQYIDTGVIAHDGLGCDLEVMFLDQANGCVLGAYKDYVSPEIRCYLVGRNDGRIGLRYNTGAYVTMQSVCEVNRRYAIVSSLEDGAQSLSVDGERVVTGTGTGTFSTYPLILFGNRFTKDTTFGNGGPMRIYRCKITNADFTETYRDFVPVRRMTDGAVGLLDRANRLFYGNAGTDVFIAGEVTVDAGRSVGELHVDVPGGTVLENVAVAIHSTVRIVKEGAGTFVATRQGQTYCGGTRIAAGTLTCGHADLTQQGAELGRGDIIVEDGGRLDTNLNNANAASLARNEVTHGCTVFVEGNGPDGETGALYNSDTSDTWGATFGRLVLTGDTALGGGQLSVRPLSGSAVGASRVTVEGPYVLTVLTPTTRTESSAFASCDFALDRLDVRGKTQFDSTIGGTVTNGVHLYDGAVVRANCTLSAGVRLVADTGASSLVAYGATTLAGGLTVQSGATFDFANAQAVNLTGAITNEGAIVHSGAGAVTISGALVGNGTLEGAIRFGGTDSRWVMVIGADGFTSKVDVTGVTTADFLAGLKGVSVTCTALPAVRTLAICPIGGLTALQVNAIVLDVVDAAGESMDGCWLGVEDGMLMLHLADAGMIRTAVWRGGANDAVDNPANWLCSNDVREVEGMLPMAATTVYLPENGTFTCTNGAKFVCKELVLPALLGGDSDFRGVEAPILGTVELAGHAVWVDSFDGAVVFTAGDYQFFDYLESTGTQYINTGLGARNDLESEIVVEFLEKVDGQVIGAYNDSTIRCYMPGKTGGKLAYRYGTAGWVSAASDYEINHKYTIITKMDRNSQSLTVDNVACAASSSSGTFNFPKGIVLFGHTFSNGKGYVFSPGGRMRIYRCKLTSDNFTTVERDLVPARQLSTGKIGMYDREHDMFYEQIGADPFVTGPMVGNGGEVHIDVAAGKTLTNTAFTFGGNLAVVKEGEGTFVAGKTDQTYAGGTVVAAGTFVCGAKSTYGESGSTVTVDAGAVFDVKGTSDQTETRFVLNGGTLTTSVAGAAGAAWITDVTLTADSYLSGGEFGFCGAFGGPTTLEMNGHTLFIDVMNGKNVYLSNLTVTGGGRIVGRSGGTLCLSGTSSRTGTGLHAPTTVLDMQGAVLRTRATEPGQVEFGGYVSSYTGATDNIGSVPMVIHSRLTLMSGAKWIPVVLQNDATLDVSALPGVLTLTDNSLSFADEATIFVQPHEKGGRIVDWRNHAPENFSKLTFKSVPDIKGYLEVDEDFIIYRKGLSIIVR